MRILATWSPADLPAIHSTPPAMLAPLGMIPGVDADGFFGVAFDPRPDAKTFEASGVSWARESERGVEISRHPEAEILMHAKTNAMIDRWRATTNREIGQGEYDRWANFAVECWLVLAAATSREESRRIDGAGRGD